MPKLDIAKIAETLNAKAKPYAVGGLQQIRTELKGLSRRPGTAVFSSQTTFPDWAFHHGGRSELQFNIGRDGVGGAIELRHGVAFSLELSQTLPTIDVLVPKVKYFNDYIVSNAEAFTDLRMWHFADDGRSADAPPGPIPPGLVRPKVFVFLGARQPADAIDYDRILTDFDRLLPLYRYVESFGKAQVPTPPAKTQFVFKAGCRAKPPATTATLAERELDLDLRHNVLQQVLYDRLSEKYGPDNVGTELPSGVGTKVDVVVRRGGDVWFYEIKTALTPRACLREALGQLLEYAFWPGAKEPTRLVVVGEAALDADGAEYLARLKARFSLPVEYEQITVEQEGIPPR